MKTPEARYPRRRRTDLALVEDGLASSREKAQALVLAGCVYLEGRRVEKASQPVPAGGALEVRGKACPYVSRGGLKLEGALREFGVPTQDRTCVDVGSSTGGFTQCLLEAGARRVYAVDVGRGQLDWTLRSDPRVVLREGVNARFLGAGGFPERIDLVTIDASFISLRILLPAVCRFAPEAQVVALVKPQFEVGRGLVGKGGIVRDESLRESVLDGISEAAAGLGYRVLGRIPSPIRGAKGNLEYLIYLIRQEPPLPAEAVRP